MLHPVEDDSDHVEVFTDDLPSHPFKNVADLKFYVPKPGLGAPGIDDIIPELKDRANQKGADAVMDVHWTLRGVRDYGVYEVTATAIAYSPDEAPPAAASTASSTSPGTGSTRVDSSRQ